jgi:NTP pyrophosphatase (non-canonical NTP hydrolase)
MRRLAGDDDTTVAVLRAEIAAFVRERDWEQFHDPKNLSMAIATEAAELMEHFRWVHSDVARDHASDPDNKAEIAAELADILAFALGFANAADIDITSALRDKMARNAKKYPADKFRGKY